MKTMTAYAIAWSATSIAISVAVIVTQSASPLWALLVPACISIKTSD